MNIDRSANAILNNIIKSDVDIPFISWVSCVDPAKTLASLSGTSKAWSRAVITCYYSNPKNNKLLTERLAEAYINKISDDFKTLIQDQEQNSFFSLKYAKAIPIIEIIEDQNRLFLVFLHEINQFNSKVNLTLLSFPLAVMIKYCSQLRQDWPIWTELEAILEQKCKQYPIHGPKTLAILDKENFKGDSCITSSSSQDLATIDNTKQDEQYDTDICALKTLTI